MQVSGRELPAETFMATIPIEAGVEMPVESRTASPGHAAAINRAGDGNTDVRPGSGSPVSVHRTSANPSETNFRAERSARYRSPSVKPIFSRLGRSRAQNQSASHHHRTQHPILHAAHNPSLAAGIVRI